MIITVRNAAIEFDDDGNIVSWRGPRSNEIEQLAAFQLLKRQAGKHREPPIGGGQVIAFRPGAAS